MPFTPQNPVAAVTHPDPYLYYAQLVEDHPFYFDAQINCWVASSVEAVRAILSNDLCRVRPVTEPVPAHIAVSPAADIFGQLVRMNDGEHHHRYKPPVVSALAGMALGQVAEQASTWAARLLDELNPVNNPERVTEFNFRLPVYTLANMLGLPNALIPETTGWIMEYLACLAPASSPEQLEAGNAASAQLLERFSHLPKVLFGSFGQHRSQALTANTIGFLTQAYEATAGLMGNTLVALGSLEIRQHAPGHLRAIVQEVARYDAPVQNTRRFVAAAFEFDGQVVAANDTILVVLAAANRDPAANPNPHQFDCFRPNRQLFTFGLGPHACPGEQLAVTIANAGLEALLALDLDIAKLQIGFTYRPSVNTRIPLFASSEKANQ